MIKKVSYLESNGKYLIMKEDGSTEVIASEKNFNEYITKNKCEIIT